MSLDIPLGSLKEYKNNISSEIDTFERRMLLMEDTKTSQTAGKENNTQINERYTEEDERLIPIKIPSSTIFK